jgi:hypothetical protein
LKEKQSISRILRKAPSKIQNASAHKIKQLSVVEKGNRAAISDQGPKVKTPSEVTSAAGAQGEDACVALGAKAGGAQR